jgi:hypothetical protein
MATDITAITDTLNVQRPKGPRQFQGAFDIIPFKVTLEDDSLAAQTGGQCDITVTGAAVGDFVLIAPPVDVTGLIFFAYVSAANTVTLNTFNMEGTDANTTMATATITNGVVLSPKGNVWDEVV